MPTYEATVDEAGRVSLPAEIVERLGIEPGQRVEFFLTLDGQVHFHAINRDWNGFLGVNGPPHRPPLSIREMDDAIADHLAEEDERIRREAREGDRPERSAAE